MQAIDIQLIADFGQHLGLDPAGWDQIAVHTTYIDGTVAHSA